MKAIIEQNIDLLKWYKENYSQMLFNKDIIENNDELELNIWME